MNTDSPSPSAASAHSLAGIDVLASVPPGVVRKIESVCNWETFPPGTWLFERGQSSTQVFFVIHGVIRVLNYSANGRVVRFASVAPGGMFGELAAIDGLPRSATVVADEPCVVAKLDATEFQNLVRSSPEFSMAVINRLASIIRACDEQILDLAELNASQRVCLHLLRLADPDPIVPQSWVVYPLPTQAVLAGDAGTTRETVARVLGRLSNQGIVQRKGRSLYIRDRDKLESLAVRESAEV